MNNYTTKTASLLAAKIKGTKADITYLNINGSPFSKVVSANAPESTTENDMWKYIATTDEDGIVSINSDLNFDYAEMTYALKAITKTAIKVVDNKVLDANDTLLMNWDTKNFTNDNNTSLNNIFNGNGGGFAPLTTFTSDLSSLTNGTRMFYYSDLESFTSDLSSLTNGTYMFYGTSLTSFTSDLSSLTNGSSMFSGTSSLTSFTSDLSSLTNGDNMFSGTSSLTSFTSDLSSLTNGSFMFSNTSLTSFTSDLSSLTNGTRMFFYASLASFTSDLSSLTNGDRMFYRTSLTSFTSDLSSLTNGDHMFYSCSSLASFTSDNLSSLTNGDHMFYLSSLESFTSDLSSLTNGSHMFTYSSLTSFTSDLSSLTNGDHMFYRIPLESFTSDLSSLTYGSGMFYITSLESFTSDLSSLTNGFNMFSYCRSLESFTSDLSSLTYGYKMFYRCKLDAQSVMFIIESIRDIVTEKASLTSDDYVTKTNNVYSKPFGWMSDGTYVYTYNNPQPYTTTILASDVGKITIGIDITNDSTVSTQLEEFAKATYYDSWADLKAAFSAKGWTVTWQYGGTDTSITLSEDEEFRGTPIWARLIEVLPAEEEYTDEEKEKASYCTEDGTKYYNIEWGHDVNEEAKDETMTDETKFFYFGSLLEACGYFGVIPKQYLEA